MVETGEPVGRFGAGMASLHRVRQLWLVKSSAIFIVSGALRGASQFLFVTVMTRLLLPADYGVYSNFLYTTAILSPLFFLRSDVPVARYYAAHPDGIAEYIGTIVMLCTGLTAVSAIVLWLCQSTVFRVTGIPGAWQMLILITCWTYGLLLVVVAVLQIELRALGISLSRLVPGVTCELLAMGAAFALSGSWRTALAAYAGASAVWALIFLGWLRLHGYMRFHFHWHDVRDFLYVSVPLIPMAIGFMSVQISAQFVLTHYSGSAEVGIYAVANQFSLGVWLIASSGQQAFLPWLFKTLNRNDRAEDSKIFGAVTGMIGVLAVSTVVYVIVFHLIFPLVVGHNYIRGGSLIGPLAWANFFLGVQMVMNCFLYHRKQTGLSAVVVCLAAACGLGLGIVYIPEGGARMAAYVTEISAALAALLTAIVVLRDFAPIFKNGGRDLFRLVASKFAAPGR